MEVIRRASQTSRPSSTLLGAQVDLSGEASPVPSWVVPSRAGATTTTTTHTTHHGATHHAAALHGYNSYAIGEPQTVTTTTTTEKTMEGTIGGALAAVAGAVSGAVSGAYTFGSVPATETHYLGGQLHTTAEGSAIAAHANFVGTAETAQYIANTTGTTTQIGGELASTGGYTTITTTGEVRKDSRVIGREYGAQRLVSETRRVDESRQSVISERYVEHEIRVPKRIVREEVIEKVYVVPETVRHEEVIDDVKIVREKIVEVAKPTIVEKVVEIPEIEWVERIVEIPERVVQEKIIHKPVVVQQERVVEVPKIITKEVPRVIPEITYRDVPVEKFVEKIEWVDKVVTREVPVPQYVDKPVPQEVIVEKAVDVAVKIPVPVEAEVIHEYHLPQIKPRYTKATYPVYLPRFIEVPVATELLREDLKLKSSAFVGQIGALTQSAASLCEIENLAAQIMKSGDINSQTAVDVQSAVMKAWQTNSLQIRTEHEAASRTQMHTQTQINAVAIPAAIPQVETVQHQHSSYVVTSRSPLHADTISKGASKKSKKSSKSHDKKN